MHILMISDVFFPRVNGVSTSIHTFMNEHRTIGNHVTLVCPDYDGNTHIIHDKEQNIIRIPARRILFDPEDRLIKKSFFNLLREIIADSRFDIIHIQTPFIAHYLGVKLSRLLGIPCIETYHTFFEEYFHHYIPLLPKALLKYFSRHLSTTQCNELDTVIVPSTAMQDVLRNYGINTPVEVIPTGLQLNNFETGNGNRFRDKYNIPQSQPLLLYVGRVALEKNISFLLHMLVLVKKQIPEVLLIIAGEGPAQKSLIKLGKKLGLLNSVLFLGYMNREHELPDCYKSANAFVFASNTETQGLVLLEALACGTPVISTAVMGTIDVLAPSEGGCVIANEDINDFSEKTINLLKDPSHQNLLRYQAGKYIQHWTASKFTRQTTRLYEKVINEYLETLDQNHPSCLIDGT